MYYFYINLKRRLKEGWMANYGRLGLDPSLTLKSQPRLRLENFKARSTTTLYREKVVFIFVIPNFQINFGELSPNYAGTLMGISNGVATICGFVGPMVAGYITNDNVS